MFVYVCGAVCHLCCVLGMMNSSDAFLVCIRAVGFDQVYAQHGSPAASQYRKKTKNPDFKLLKNPDALDLQQLCVLFFFSLDNFKW